MAVSHWNIHLFLTKCHHMNIMKISCYNCFWHANVWSISVCERMLQRWYPYMLTERCLKTEFLLYQNGASQACDFIAMHCKPAVLPPPVSSLSGIHPHIAHLWAAQTAAFIIRVKDVPMVINKYRKVNLWEKLSLLSPELPWLAGEHWQDLVLDQRQLFWAPGQNGYRATELVIAVLVFTR